MLDVWEQPKQPLLTNLSIDSLHKIGTAVSNVIVNQECRYSQHPSSPPPSSPPNNPFVSFNIRQFCSGVRHFPYCSLDILSTRAHASLPVKLESREVPQAPEAALVFRKCTPCARKRSMLNKVDPVEVMVSRRVGALKNGRSPGSLDQHLLSHGLCCVRCTLSWVRTSLLVSGELRLPQPLAANSKG